MRWFGNKAGEEIPKWWWEASESWENKLPRTTAKAHTWETEMNLQNNSKLLQKEFIVVIFAAARSGLNAQL